MKAPEAYRITESQLFAPQQGELFGATVVTDGSVAVAVKFFEDADATDSTKCMLVLSVPIGMYGDAITFKPSRPFTRLYVEFTSGEGELIIYAYDPKIWAFHATGFGSGPFGGGGFG